MNNLTYLLKSLLYSTVERGLGADPGLKAVNPQHADGINHKPGGRLKTPSRRRISELAAEFLSAEYQPTKIRISE